MREPLKPYVGPEALNYLCIVMTELLGEPSLTRAPALLSGYLAVTTTLPPRVALALENLRLADQAPGTIRGLRLAIENYRAHFLRIDRLRQRGLLEGETRGARFRIGDDFSVCKAWTDFMPADVAEAITVLTQPLPIRESKRPPSHDHTRAADLLIERHNYSTVVSALDFEPKPVASYDVLREQKAIGRVTWADLTAMADEFDCIDVAAGRQASGERSWYLRLYERDGTPRAELMAARQDGLVPEDGIELSGLKHLIGLPGAGKTTILYLLAAVLAQRGHRACFLYSSIEVATAFIETLAKYDVHVGLLYGQGDRARNRHVMNFAASLGSQNNGFGATRLIAPLFATNCALAGFVADEDQHFPHSRPPCLDVRQKPEESKTARNHRCALAGSCGRQRAERELIGAPIWAGHILSIDRGLSPVFSAAKIRHFEYLARAFDLLVVDECDGAQTDLDRLGTPMMKLVGDAGALAATLYKDVHSRAAGASNSFINHPELPAIMEMTARFGVASHRLASRIAHSERKFRDKHANMLHTSGSLIADMFPSPDDEDESERHERTREAFERLWDVAAKHVAFRSHRQRRHVEEDEDDQDGDLNRDQQALATAAGVERTAVVDFYASLLESLEQWDREGSDETMAAIIQALSAVPGLSVSLPQPVFASYGNLLVTVSLLVLQHFGLAPHLRLMNSEGLVSDEVFESRPSKDVMAVIPEALVGRLSGVRFTVSEEGDVDIAHVNFDGTPRLLPHRMHELSKAEGGAGLAVLFTSATSMLEASPSYHVDIGPHYVLRRPNAGEGWSESVYRCLPLRDPDIPDKMLKFSGSRYDQRDRVLCSMVDELLRNGPLSYVANAMASNDVRDAVGRKVGLIVNSYDQCALLFRHIETNHRGWNKRVRYLVRANPSGRQDPAGVTAAEVERLGHDPDWDILIFPMNAIGRGVNIVYQFGPRTNQAMLGSLFFLTRPHPRGDSLQLMQGLVGRASARFDARRFQDSDEALSQLRAARKDMSQEIRKLLRMTLAAQSLGQFAPAFVADQMIIILQTIGRAMRGDCPAFVYFVDAAWAPGSAIGSKDTARTSFLVMMKKLLRECLEHPDPARRQCYENLYRPFFAPLSQIQNLDDTL